MSHVLKTAEGRYYVGVVNDTVITSPFQSSAYRFEDAKNVRIALREVLRINGGVALADARPVYLKGFRGMPARPSKSGAT